MTAGATFRTRSIDLGVFLKFAMPEGSHLVTRRNEDGSGTGNGHFVFVFASPEECRSLADEFYSAEPVAIGDLWTLNRVGRELRRTMRHAERFGEWNLEKEKENQ